MKNQIAIACLGVVMVVGMEALADKAVPVADPFRPPG